MPIELWTPNDLMMLRRDDRMDELPSFFLDEYFPEADGFYAEDGEVRFGDLEESTRFMAPFVLPYEEGKANAAGAIAEGAQNVADTMNKEQAEAAATAEAEKKD